jgi:hypothetical protein
MKREEERLHNYYANNGMHTVDQDNDTSTYRPMVPNILRHVMVQYTAKKLALCNTGTMIHLILKQVPYSWTFSWKRPTTTCSWSHLPQSQNTQYLGLGFSRNDLATLNRHRQRHPHPHTNPNSNPKEDKTTLIKRLVENAAGNFLAALFQIHADLIYSTRQD